LWQPEPETEIQGKQKKKKVIIEYHQKQQRPFITCDNQTSNRVIDGDRFHLSTKRQISKEGGSRVHGAGTERLINNPGLFAATEVTALGSMQLVVSPVGAKGMLRRETVGARHVLTP
jgi:hypothetical protein